MFFFINVALCILSGLVSLVSFVLYVQARMHEQERKEARYRSVHFASLTFFVAFGVMILIQLSNRLK
ncbi:MAG: hypothetical protein Q8927_01655 [Bacteroidota bacterium]|nr:hypothetical protein [Bacteroidota bacterium]MDP4214876.1 hypothetical protein [Bacteroidota bacterium]MDP4244738.1 hypothetical protein [Bacteroidota bacterium]MDP4252402.1 hypothetical protein [Bacteroidota bacterium]MDP4257959.1 hypothetical protein [Bacteroidota bacterium]